MAESVVGAYGGHTLHAHDPSVTLDQSMQRIRDVVKDGSALSKFKAMIEGQGVERQVAADLCDVNKDVFDTLPKAKFVTDLTCSKGGHVERIKALPIAKACHKLGGGRNAPGESVDLAVGAQLLVDTGDKVTAGQPWVRVHHSQENISAEVMAFLTDAIIISDQHVDKRTTRLLDVYN